MTLEADLTAASASQAALASWLEGLPEHDPGSASALEGWSLGHVLTHLARNADSFVRVLAAAEAGQEVTQYEGGAPARVAAIEAGSARSWAELVADVVSSSASLEATWKATPAAVWDAGRWLSLPGPVPLAFLPWRRRREVEIHRVDLGLGYTTGEWPADFVADELGRSIAGLRPRLPEGVEASVATDLDAIAARGASMPVTLTVELRGGAHDLTAPAHQVLGWTLGRLRLPGWPELAPWG